MNPNFIKLKTVIRKSVFLAGVGFVSILGQVVILRELSEAFFGIELIYILSLGAWLLGTAIGAVIGKKSSFPNRRNIKNLFFLFALILPADILFIRGIRKIFGAVPGAFMPFTEQILGLLAALIPLSIITGLLFQWTAKLFISEKETLAKAYSFESAGGVIGGLTSTLLLSAGLQNFTLALLCSSVSMSIFFYASSNKLKFTFKISLIVAALIFIVLFASSRSIDRWMTSWNYEGAAESLDTPYNRITITSAAGQYCVFEDGALCYESEGVSAEEFVQLSTLQTNRLNSVLVLGGGFHGIIFELLKLPVDKINYVEINRPMTKLLMDYLPAEIYNSLLNKKVKITYDDPRKYLNNKKLFDVILINMPEPTSAQTNRFYTKEFFSECSMNLAPKGIAAFKIQSSENLWTSALQNRNSSIYNALKISFKNIIVLPGTRNIFIASNDSLTGDTKVLIDRFNSRQVSAKLVSPPYISYIYSNDRFAEIQNILSTNGTEANSDFKPACYGLTISIWLSKFFPQLNSSTGVFSSAAKSLMLIAIAAVLILLIYLKGKYVKAKRAALVFGAGFIGMVMETLLLILYQTKNGILYRDIGALLMMFMLGLSLGAFAVDNLFISERNIKPTLAGRILILIFFAANLGAYFLEGSEYFSGIIPIGFALLLDGFFVSGIFAYASLNKIENQAEQVKPLYSADLIGGCVGSVASSLFLIPVLGLPATLLILAALTLYLMSFLA